MEGDNTMADDKNELNLNNLEEVTGGTSPLKLGAAPAMTFRQAHAIINNAASTVKNEKGDPMEGVNINTEAMECPKCHSIAVKFDQVGGAYMCQDCGNIVTIQN